MSRRSGSWLPMSSLLRTLSDLCGQRWPGASADERSTPEPRVLSLSAQNLAGVWQDIRAIGAVLELGDQAEELVLGLQSRLRKLEAERSAHSPAGPLHRMARSSLPGRTLGPRAGGRRWRTGCRRSSGQPLSPAEWADLSALEPDRLLIMLCGFGDRTASGGAGAARPSGSTGIVIPGPDLDHGRQRLHLATRPRLVDGAEQDAVGIRRPDHGESRAVGHSSSMLTIAQANGHADDASGRAICSRNTPPRSTWTCAFRVSRGAGESAGQLCASSRRAAARPGMAQPGGLRCIAAARQGCL